MGHQENNRRSDATIDPAIDYGESFADVYDDWYAEISDVDATVELISALVGTGRGRVLELGVGTGRLAIPLARGGLDIDGLDNSPLMLQRLRAKDPGGRVGIHVGNMAGPLPSGPWQVVFVAYNTLFNLVSSVEQKMCFESVASVLDPDGWFVVEAFVPTSEGIGPTRGVVARDLPDGGRVLNISVRVPGDQIVRGTHVELRATGQVRLRPWTIRYLHPSQIDRMAAEHGLELAARWGDWDRRSYDGSVRHVSAYRPRGARP